MQEWVLVVFICNFFSMAMADADPDYATVCDRLQCKIDEHCVIRRFWCDYTPCPTMTYCSKSKSESLRGPNTCESVQCPDEYKCALRVRDCTWEHGCKQNLARCLSEVELADEPASCTNINCGKGHHCVLRETHYCPRPPCRLTKSCAYAGDVKIWFDKCRQLGCRSEHECFLRRPSEKCATSSCGHVPDCLVTPDTFESTSSKSCHGWICPTDQVCSARLPISCSSPGVNCPILRSCDRYSRDLTQPLDAQTTLTDLERDIFLEEQRRLQQSIKPSSFSNFTQTRIQQYYDDVLLTGQSRKNADNAASTPMKSRRVSVSPIMRSTSQHDGDSAWLTYLKRRAGAEAVRYWIDKAKSNQDYEGFVEWLDMVSQLLDPDTYRLWLMEVELASANVPEFQAWISPRNLAAHRLATASAIQRTLPVSIADKLKNLFYSDKSLVFADQRQNAESGGASRQQSNFKFNEASQLGDVRLTHLEIPAQPRSPSDLGYGLSQDFGEAVKNSWKSWEPYYQLNPPSPSGFANRIANTHSSNNYTKAPRRNASVPQMFFMDDRYATTLKRDDDNVAAQSLRTMADQIRDFKNFRPNVAKLDYNQPASQLMLSSTTGDDDNLPNLLIYFPSPLNFFIYYSVRGHNHTSNGNISLRNDDENDSDPRSKVGTRMSNSGSYIPEDYDDNHGFSNKTGPIDKQKEFEFIRKIIRELINYWDDEERTFEKSEKSHDDSVKVRMGIFNESTQHITSAQTDKMKPDEDEENPSFDTFLKWLHKNGHINSTQLSDLSLKSKQSSVNEDQEKRDFSSPNFENNKNTTLGKIRILLDIDKNPEIVKKLFSGNNANNQNDSNSRQYQMVVNLNEYVDPREEDIISQRLINMASKELHRNISGYEKMPKVLWVFPVYGNEENETMINEEQKRINEKVNTLEDVDAPKINTDDTDRTHYTPNNHNTNSGNDKMDYKKNVDNYNNSMKDTEDEYYDDQDMYDEEDYEQSESNQSMENGSSKK